MKFKTYSLGCKVNIYEVEAISASLKETGWILEENDAKCDVIIINTCTVTATSDSKSKQLIRKIRRLAPQAIIVAMGCFVQLNDKIVEEELSVDIIIGTNKRHMIKELVETYLQNKQKLNYVLPATEYVQYEELKMHSLSTHTRGFVKIQDGCGNFCTYCAIPYARGPIKSRKKECVVDEIQTLVTKGVKEIILAGINTGTYGQDLEDISLAGLLKLIIQQVQGIYRLRLSSIELMEITDELLDVYELYPHKLAQHFHIPLQAGCDNTLKRMNRKYSTKEYEMVLKNIRSRFPNIAITTDCLAGFVGENEADFEEALKFIGRMGYADMHIFPYSRRKGTKADLMDGHLNPQIINRRAKLMQNLAIQLKNDYQWQFLGQEMLVLVEQKKKGLWYGHTSNYLEIIFEKDEELTNKVVLVRLNKLEKDIIKGEFIKEVQDAI